MDQQPIDNQAGECKHTETRTVGINTKQNEDKTGKREKVKNLYGWHRSLEHL